MLHKLCQQQKFYTLKQINQLRFITVNVTSTGSYTTILNLNIFFQTLAFCSLINYCLLKDNGKLPNLQNKYYSQIYSLHTQGYQLSYKLKVRQRFYLLVEKYVQFQKKCSYFYLVLNLYLAISIERYEFAWKQTYILQTKISSQI